MTCKYCANLRKCIEKANKEGYEHNPDFDAEDGCPNFGFKRNTNADRIRAMSDEELAKWLVEKTMYQESAWSEPSYLNFLTETDDTMESAIKGTVKWLKQPAEVE